MKKILAGSVIAALATGLSFVVFATGGDGKGDLRVGGDGPLTMAIYGDSPYSQVPANYNTPAPYGVEHSELDATPAFIDAINNDKKVKLVVHVGDIHSGKEPCTLAYNNSVYGLWTDFHDPLVYTPGDNEWTDCNKSGEAGNTQDPVTHNYIDYANGDPVANLALVRQLAFSEPGETLGGGHMKVVSQADAFDPNHPTDAEYVENVMWEQAGVMFVTINVPGGSNNDTDPWYTVTPLTGEQVQEWNQRTAADTRWLDAAFTQAEADHVGGVVIITQADMWDLDGKATATDPPAKYTARLGNLDAIIEDIATNTTTFGNPVLLFNGDSHMYRSDNPMVNDPGGANCLIETGPDTTAQCQNGTTLANAWATHPEAPLNTLAVTNFHRVVVHGNTKPLEYLRLTIDVKHPPAPGANSFGPFSWERVQPQT
jgi:hypothetical protein